MGEKPKRKSKYNKRLISLGVLCCLAIFLVYFCVTFIKQQIKISSLKDEAQEISSQINDQREYSKELNENLKKENENKRIEELAREKLGYLKKDEILFIDSSEK